MDIVLSIIFLMFLIAPSMFGEQFAHIKRAYDAKLIELAERDKERARRKKLP